MKMTSVDEPDGLPSRAELARELLLRFMCDFAEESCASWLVDQQFELWEAAFLGRFPETTSIFGPREDFCKRLGDLGTLANGWLACASSVRPEGHERVFLSTDEFHPFYVGWQRQQEGRITLNRSGD